jgi:hypothetical protein
MVLVQCKPKESVEELAKSVPPSSLVFKARIVALHTNTTGEEDVSNTGVATVTNVIDAPDMFKDMSGQQVTIRFSDIGKMKTGEERMFFAEPYSIGESIGVQENASAGKGDKLYEDTAIAAHVQLAKKNHEDEEIRKLANESKFVVLGKVTKISEPEKKTIVGSEHDPGWREAEIEVGETIKGKVEGKTIKLLFASSNDVMFFNAPKFKVNDEGVFIIGQSDNETVKLIGNENMVIEPKGFIQGKESASRIKALLK